MDLADGHAALAEGDLPEAASKLRRAIKLGPPSAEAQAALGATWNSKGRRRRRRGIPEGLELNPQSPGPQGPPEPGRTFDLRPPSGSDPGIRGADSTGQVQGGGAACSTDYVEQHPTSSWGWYALGYSQFAQQKIGESIKSLAKSLELDVANADAHKILGRNMMMIGRFDAAQVEFEQGIRYKPDSAELHYNLGKLHSIQDNWESARNEFEAAVRLDPAYVEALDALGLAMEALGHDEDAVADYEKAVALNDARHGTFASAHVNLSAYYNRTDHPDKALDYATKALELDPRSDRALFQKATAQERQGQLGSRRRLR